MTETGTILLQEVIPLDIMYVRTIFTFPLNERIVRKNI